MSVSSLLLFSFSFILNLNLAHFSKLCILLNGLNYATELLDVDVNQFHLSSNEMNVNDY